ncbi:hypothetical protein FRC06_005238 [Ceratobasidium sp. 370]|nr:hypothetical protein FRC06_005238 [Ceratobasidium sp. 370]
MTDSTFNARVGRYRFDPPTGTHTWTSRVQEWADRARVQIQWQRATQGPPHQLTIIETPIIDGVLHPEYRGVGRSSAEARNAASYKIACSGHCVSDV